MYTSDLFEIVKFLKLLMKMTDLKIFVQMPGYTGTEIDFFHKSSNSAQKSFFINHDHSITLLTQICRPETRLDGF